MSDTRYQLSKPQLALVLHRYRLGRDVSTTYRTLWPSGGAPVTLGQFIHLYMEAVVSFLQPVGEERRAALSGDDAENMAQLREVRDLLLDALRECRENPVVDEGDGERPKLSDRMRLVAGIATAHSQTIKSMREIDKKRIETAAALHSLLASNADRDGDDIIDMPPPDESAE